MVAQLEHLLKLVELPNVEIRLLPSDGRGAFAVGAFSLLTRADDHQPFMAIVPALDQPHYVEHPPTINLFRSTFERLLDVALDAEESERLITELLETYR